jgi:hypothetical protein
MLPSPSWYVSGDPFIKLGEAFSIEEVLYIKGIGKFFTYKYRDSYNLSK